MPTHHIESEIYDFITGDFHSCWDALAAKTKAEASNRGNFLFALQAAILLEWIGRLCANDPTARQDFASELHKIDPRYFADLPDRCPAPSQDFTFPGLPGKDERKSLLAALWELIRNGQAHEYHDIIVGLTCGKRWVLAIKGVIPMLTLAEVDRQRPNLRHLDYQIAPDGDLLLGVHPGVFFLDVCVAVDNANLLRRGLTITHLLRPRNPNTYQYSLSQLDAALAANGLKKVASVESAPILRRQVPVGVWCGAIGAVVGAAAVLVVQQLLRGW
jgi:hypothetical protein